MDILNNSLTDFSFEDVVSFCEQKVREGVQVDYKRDLPKDGLAKHFAAFSNTRGGVIIIGVEEDKQTGLPIKWDGVKVDTQTVERVCQWASNVDPLPRYEVHVTNAINGNSFVLTRIYEGDKTPYYVQNDPNIWIRTGNITVPVDLASPDAVALMFGKRQTAENARQNNINRALGVFDATIRRGERKRKDELNRERQNYLQQNPTDTQLSNFKPKHSESRPVGEGTSICTIILQPYYPTNSLAMPRDIKTQIHELRKHPMLSSEALAYSIETMPDGVFWFSAGSNGFVFGEQIYSSGLIFTAKDVLHIDQSGKKQIEILDIFFLLFSRFKMAQTFYSTFGYQGVLTGSVSLSGVEGVMLSALPQVGGSFPRHFFIDQDAALLTDYRWDINLDTLMLNNDLDFQNYFVELMRQIEWGFGYETSAALIEGILKANSWFVDAPKLSSSK